MNKPWITIIGINHDDISTLNKLALKALFEAEIIFGAKRHLNLFNNFKKKCKILPVPIKKTFQKLKNNQGKKIVILVSGNAFWFGLGSLISRQFNRDEWQCFQAPSSFSLASAEMGWRMEDVMFFGLHAKKLEVIRASIAPNIKFIILLRDGNSVKKLTNFFTENGFGDSKFTIFESLGYKNFKKKNTVAKNNNFINLKHPLCVAIETRGNGLVIPSNSGIPDLFFANDGQITKQYIRSITLSALSPMPYKHLWDLGSGSGSIAVEWLLSEKTTTVSAVEKNKKRIKLAKKYEAKRKKLKKIVMDKKVNLNERFEAALKLAKLPKNSAKNRIRNRCEITGRPHGYYRKLKMSRIALRELASMGKIPGMTKSSW